MTEFAAEWIFGGGPPQGIPFAGGLGLAGVQDASGLPSFLEPGEEKSDYGADAPPAAPPRRGPIEEFTPAFRLSRKPATTSVSETESLAEAAATPADEVEADAHDEPGPIREEEVEESPAAAGSDVPVDEEHDWAAAVPRARSVARPRVALSRSPERQSRPDRPVVAARRQPAATPPSEAAPTELSIEASGGFLRRLARAVTRRPSQRDASPPEHLPPGAAAADLPEAPMPQPTVATSQPATAGSRTDSQATRTRVSPPAPPTESEPEVREEALLDLPPPDLPAATAPEPESGEPSASPADIASDAPSTSGEPVPLTVARLEREPESASPDESASPEDEPQLARPAPAPVRPLVHRAPTTESRPSERAGPPERTAGPTPPPAPGIARSERATEPTPASAALPSPRHEVESVPARRSGPLQPLLRTIGRQIRRERRVPTVENGTPAMPLDAEAIELPEPTASHSPPVPVAPPRAVGSEHQPAMHAREPTRPDHPIVDRRPVARHGRPPVQISRVARTTPAATRESHPRSTAGLRLADSAGTTFTRSGDGLETVDFVWPPWEESAAASAPVALLARAADEAPSEPVEAEAPAAAPSTAPTSATAPSSSAPAPAAHGGSDIEDIYEQVIQRLRRELLVERERMGDLLGDLP
jgi:hypothetical protein